jgi:hypothetical protein
VPSDKPTPPKSNVFTKPANGATAGSYQGDGRWNIGGWSTYPSAAATFTEPRRPAKDGSDRK